MVESVLLASIMGAQAVLLGIVSRLRFRIFPDPETGKCTCLSGCSEVPLTDSHEAVDCHEHEVGGATRMRWGEPRALQWRSGNMTWGGAV